MKNHFQNHKSEFNNWVLSVREVFDCDKKETHIKIWEYLLLLFISYSKEIFNFFIAIFGSGETKTLASLFNVYPFSYELFWLLLLKLGLGYISLLYFQIKYNNTETIWHIWIFWAFCIFNPLLSSLESRFDVVNGLANFVRFSIQFLFFIYFFAIDTVHLDSLKMLLWDNLDIDPVTGRVYRTPHSRISKSKLKKLFVSSISIVGVSMLILVFTTRIIAYFSPTVTAGDTKPENQRQIEDVFKKNWLPVIFSSVIVAPVLEEWLFRRFILKNGQFKWWTILISGFIFGLIHLRPREGIIPLIPYVIPGLVFAVSMFVSKNIWHTIFAHSLYNLVTVINMMIRG